MKKINKTKIFATLSFIPILFLLGLFLFTGENIEILKTVFSKDLSNEEIQEHLSGFGIRGQITISILAALQIIVAVLPAEPVQVVAGLTFGFFIGTLACIVGVIVGNSLIYLLYKLYGDKMRAYFDSKIDIDFSTAKTGYKITIVIFILYFLPAIPYGMICFLAATLGMKYPKYILVTTLGAIPSVCIGVGLGHVALASSWIVSVAVFGVLVLLLSLVMLKKDYFIGKINEYLKKSKEPYSSKTVVKSYPKRRLTIPYWIFRLCMLGKLKFKIIKKVDKVEHPSIVLCNHGAFIDFCFAGTALKSESPNFVVARLYFYKKLLGNLMRRHGCFPKSMFVTDTESAMNCMRVIKAGGVLGMMPEARLSTVGRFEDIQESTFSFLKKMGVTVYTVKINGDYLAKPKWGNGIRRGSLVEAELDILFTPQQLADMEISEIKERTEKALYYDELEWLKTKPHLHYRSKKLAHGLENILTRCPVCGAKYSIATDKNRVFCEKCDLSTTLTDRYEFTDAKPFENFVHWYDWQCDLIRSEITENESYELTSDVELRHASKDGKTLLTLAGEGKCTLSRDGLTYVGTEFGKEITKHFPSSVIYRLLFGSGEDFEIYEGKEIYYFTPRERRSCVDWYVASIVLHDINSAK
ncbi:MAG: VTT domain-containing protein [Clostridia bacterium]|nr:VTT domain-containing protein [Clostridia bacterium]